MSANIDMTNNRANIAFLGSRNDIWHRMGQEMTEGQSIEEWIKAAGLGWSAIKVPAIAALSGPEWDHIEASKRFQPVTDRSFICRSDNGYPLGFVSGESEAQGYQSVQPNALFHWFDRYLQVDHRFKLDVAGSLDGGKRIWATAKFNGDFEVAGEKHLARVLMSTTFDASGCTTNQATMIRAICNNTVRAALADPRAMIKTRHSSKFDAARVGRELGQLAQGFQTFKAVGDAMATVEMSVKEVSNFFKKLLEIPFEAKEEDVSTRKMNQFRDLNRAYKTSVQEGAEQCTPWAALQAVTRYVDHDRSVQKGDMTEAVARFRSAQFGSGDAMKGEAMNLLLPLIKDKVLIPV